MTFHRSILITIFSITALFSFGQPNHFNGPASIPLSTTFTPSDYNGGIQNWDITQDSLGFLYVANNYGLLEFDGTSWSNYEVPSSTKTRAVAVHHSTNRIFVGGQREFGYFKKEKEGFVYHDLVGNIPESVLFDEVWDVVAIFVHDRDDIESTFEFWI